LNYNRNRISYILKKDTAVGKEKILYNRETKKILREYSIYLYFFKKLLSLEFPRFGDFDHDTRVDLVNKKDISAPDPVDTRILVLNIYSREKDIRREKSNVLVFIKKRDK